MRATRPEHVQHRRVQNTTASPKGSILTPSNRALPHYVLGGRYLRSLCLSGARRQPGSKGHEQQRQDSSKAGVTRKAFRALLAA